MSWNSSRAALGAVLPLSLLLAACGGGTNSKYEGSILSGQVLMGAGQPVSGNGIGNVCIYAIAPGGLGNPLNTAVSPPISTGTLLTTGCIPTAANGTFSVNLTSYYGPVLIQISGGTYTNAANQAGSSLANLATTNASLQAVSNIGGGGTVTTVVTPLTTVATAITQSMPGGLTVANYAAASANVAAQFQLGGLSINTPPQAGDAYNMALLGVQQYLVAPPGSNDPNANNLFTWNLAASPVAADYTAAYQAINSGSTASFTFH